MSDRDLAHHYKVLKQFLDISDDDQTTSSRSKTHSTRAERAREKLLKLSYTQFKELSTDVYDELKRRIDESKGEPDYLLPKNTFHPKRNQARQKLASLPQNRFKDLVSDISYELERRDLHKAKRNNSTSTTTSNGFHQRTTSNPHSLIKQEHPESYFPQDEHRQHVNNKSISSHKEIEQVKEEDEDVEEEPKQLHLPGLLHSETSHSLQPTQVIPTKANLEWSSDEEEEQDEDEESRRYTFDHSQISDQLDKSVEEVKEEVEEKHVEPVVPDNSELLDLKSQLEKIKQELSQSQQENQNLQKQLDSVQADYDYSIKQNKTLVEHSDANKQTWNNKIMELQQELDTMKNINSSLRLENQSIKTSQPNITLSSPPPKKSINRDIDLFLEKLENLDLSKTNSPISTSSPFPNDLRNQVKLWQRRYEELRSSNIAKEIKKSTVNKPDLKKYVSSQGLISIRLVSDAYALVDSFLVYISQPNFDADVLFEKISKISIIINEIANQGDCNELNSNEHSVLIREATTHVLTATRYHATYKNLMPRFIVEKAINELMFLICDLISASKLHENSGNLRLIDPKKQPQSQLQQQSSPNEDFGVRPLRMANKLKQLRSPIQTKTPMIEVASPGTTKDQSPFVEDVSSSTKIESSPILEKTKSVSPLRHRSPEKSNSPTRQKGSPSPLRTSSPSRYVNKLTSKFENSKSTSPSQLPSKDQSTPSPTAVRKLAQRISSETSQKNESPARISPTGPAKKSILDKVRQFETSPLQQKITQHVRSQSGDDSTYNDSTRDLIKEQDQIGGGKRILQSLKDAAAATAASTNEGDAGVISKSDTTESDNELDNTSTAETTPSQESDEHERSVHEKTFDTTTIIQNQSIPGSQDTLNDTTTQQEASPVKAVVKKTKPTKTVKIQEPEYDSDSEPEDVEMKQARQRQEARKSMAAAQFNVDLFDIDDPDNTLTQVLLYLEHQTVEVISTIQSLLGAIKKPEVTRGELRTNSSAITQVITQMTEATRTSMNQTRNHALKEHGGWVVQSLEDCTHRMEILCKPRADKSDSQFGDKNFKQRLAGISFDIAKCIKELVKSVEEASLKEDIAQLETRISHIDDLT
ncbi:Protein SPA2 [Spathaspora sp. JA1]|nr:Protein SPA2 [Spathaspora sp. JA1]